MLRTMSCCISSCLQWGVTLPSTHCHRQPALSHLVEWSCNCFAFSLFAKLLVHRWALPQQPTGYISEQHQPKVQRKVQLAKAFRSCSGRWIWILLPRLSLYLLSPGGLEWLHDQARDEPLLGNLRRTAPKKCQKVRQTVHIYPPARTTFGGLTDGACINTVKSSGVVWMSQFAKKNTTNMRNKKAASQGKKQLRPCGYQGSCVAELAVPNSPYIRGLELSGVLGWACMWKTIKNQVSLVQMQPHHPIISWPCDIVVSWLPFPCLSLDSRRLFGISVSDVYIFMFFWVFFLPPASSCMAQCVNDVPLRWPGCPSGSLVRWLAPQSQVLRSRRKVLENNCSKLPNICKYRRKTTKIEPKAGS